MCRNLKNFAVFISGGGSNLQALIDGVESGEIKGNLSLIVSNRKNAFGLERGKKHNIKSLYLRGDNISQDEFDGNLLKILEEEKIDFIVLAGFLKILGKDFIKKYENKIINIHPSLIPAFCGDGFYGLKVHEEALKYGVKLSGATTHFVTEEADAGPIIMQSSVVVKEGDRPEDLQKRVLEIEHKILLETVKDFCEDKIFVDGRIVKRGR